MNNAPQTTRRPEPPQPRGDTPCAECGGPRTVRTKATLHHDEANLDPFCRTECAKAYFAVTISSFAESRKPQDYLFEWRKEHRR